MEKLEGGQQVDRRSMLRKAAMGGAVVWTMPVVQTLGSGVAAAATVTYAGCPGTGGGTPPRQLVFRWTGAACAATDAPAYVSSSGTTDTAINQSVNVHATYGTGNFAGETTTGPVAVNGTFTIGDGTKKMNPETTIELRDPSTGAVLRTVTIHTSCSQPLEYGDTYCGLVLIGGF